MKKDINAMVRVVLVSVGLVVVALCSFILGTGAADVARVGLGILVGLMLVIAGAKP